MIERLGMAFYLGKRGNGMMSKVDAYQGWFVSPSIGGLDDVVLAILAITC